jgi:ParB-like chromosome segregation protein Spo0J
MKTKNEIINEADTLFSDLEKIELNDRIEIINHLNALLHKISPFKKEPVDYVKWVPADQVVANDYNPNIVAPPEMKLLEHSIREDGYTQPIVAWIKNGHYEVVDGFHRNRIGKEIKDIKNKLMGYLPLTIINPEKQAKGDRISSTIRHNRARGKHSIDGMANIIIELKRRNWSDKKISKQIGMDPDEILRLSQITGLAEMFKDKDFSEAWEADLSNTIDENDNLTDG